MAAAVLIAKNLAVTNNGSDNLYFQPLPNFQFAIIIPPKQSAVLQPGEYQVVASHNIPGRVIAYVSYPNDLGSFNVKVTKEAPNYPSAQFSINIDLTNNATEE